MTTIVTDGLRMLADGRCTAGGQILTDNDKKLCRLSSGAVAGIAGTAAHVPAVLNWLEDRTQPRPQIEDPMEILLISKKGTFYLDGALTEVRVPDMFAIGSGGCYAIGALAAGSSLKQALSIGIQNDAYSGGSMTSMKLK